MTLVALATLSGGWAPAAPALLGERFSERTFPLCQTYGCRVTERSTVPGGSSVRLQLKRWDARLLLVLSPYGTVMGLEVWVPGGEVPSAAALSFLQRVAVQAAEQEFPAGRLGGCFARLGGRPAGPRSHRLLGGGGEHYGVVCLRKPGAWGMRVYFDR